MRTLVSILLIAATSTYGAEKKITIGLVAKSQSNPVFQAAYAGAKEAAKELGPKYGVEVTIDWQTPPDEDAQKQAEAIEQLARGGAQGIAISCSDANGCTPAINKATELGSVVVCFDSDAPRSKRLCYYGTDDMTCGRAVMAELAKVMDNKGTIAILAGNQTAPNLQKRVEGVKDELKKHPDIKLLPDGTFYHAETPEQSAEAVNTAQTTHPQIEGWAMVGGWPLFAKNALKWAPGSVKVVSVDALPAELNYVKNGYVAALYAQDCYGWGYKSVEILLNKIVKGQNPASERIIDPLTRVTKENVDEIGKNWNKWLGKESGVIEFESITKTFGGVTALDGVTFSIARGECHGLMGENGAGKSTLGKILAGIHRPDNGEIRVDGKPQHLHSPRDAVRTGIGMVHQELAFCPDLTVAENLCLGRYPRRSRWFADRRAMDHRARQLLGEIGVTMDVGQPMRGLTTGHEQLVQIAAAVGTGANVLVFDEPTSSLSETESRQLFKLIELLKQRGVTMIYVSHRLPEVGQLCDRVSVLRDGRYIGTLDRAEFSQSKVVQMMIGRPLAEYFPQHLGAKAGETKLRVAGLSSPGKFENVSFEIRAGEIVGFAGLVGSGRSEVAQAIFGLDKEASGTIELDGKRLPLGRVRIAMRRGLGLVPEDRKRQGLVLLMSCRRNFSLVILDRLRRWGLLNHRQEAAEAGTLFARLRVKTPSIETPIASLSGGNQQKVVIAKWLARHLKVLIVDEPTRGVDVGAKAEIHALIDELARQGSAVLLISSELPEVINLSTRILIMRQGRLVGEVQHEQATQDNLMRLMAGIGEKTEDRGQKSKEE